MYASSRQIMRKREFRPSTPSSHGNKSEDLPFEGSDYMGEHRRIGIGRRRRRRSMGQEHRDDSRGSVINVCIIIWILKWGYVAEKGGHVHVLLAMILLVELNKSPFQFFLSPFTTPTDDRPRDSYCAPWRIIAEFCGIILLFSAPLKDTKSLLFCT